MIVCGVLDNLEDSDDLDYEEEGSDSSESISDDLSENDRLSR